MCVGAPVTPLQMARWGNHSHNMTSQLAFMLIQILCTSLSRRCHPKSGGVGDSSCRSGADITSMHDQQVSNMRKSYSILIHLDCYIYLIIIPPEQQSCLGDILVSLHPSVCLSVHPSAPHTVYTVVSTVLVRSISYLCILSSNFRRYVAYKVSCKILEFEFLGFLKICNFESVLF